MSLSHRYLEAQNLADFAQNSKIYKGKLENLWYNLFLLTFVHFNLLYLHV